MRCREAIKILPRMGVDLAASFGAYWGDTIGFDKAHYHKLFGSQKLRFYPGKRLPFLSAPRTLLLKGEGKTV
jgi:hypothetical protein